MKTLIIAIWALIALTIGNYFYQYLEPSPDYSAAFRYSYFQTCAITYFALLLWWFKDERAP